MVERLNKEGKNYFKCEVCYMYYPKEGLAQECENFCKENNACDVNLIKHSVDIKNE